MARTRRLRTLLALWAAYWAGLVAWEAGPVLMEYLRLRATDGHGTVSWSFTGSATVLSLALVGPPLLLWALWLLVPERRGVGRDAPRPTAEAGRRPAELRGAPYPEGPPERDARVRLPVDDEAPRR